MEGLTLSKRKNQSPDPVPQAVPETATEAAGGETPVTDPTQLRGKLADKLAPEYFNGIVEEFLTFLRARLKTVRTLTDVSDPEVNLTPLLMLALAPAYNLYSPFEVAEYIQMAKFPHGDATSFGMRLDSRLMSIFGVGRPVEKKTDPETFTAIDNEIAVKRKRYLISLKSGPRTMNQAHANEMIKTFPKVHNKTGCDIIIGIAYGKKEKVNNKPGLVVKSTGSYVHVLIGKSFWEFITGVQNGHLEIYRAIRGAQRQFAAENQGRTFHEQMIEARLALARSFRETFDLTGADDIDMWDEIFKHGF